MLDKWALCINRTVRTKAWRAGRAAWQRVKSLSELGRGVVVGPKSRVGDQGLMSITGPGAGAQELLTRSVNILQAQKLEPYHWYVAFLMHTYTLGM